MRYSQWIGTKYASTWLIGPSRSMKVICWLFKVSIPLSNWEVANIEAWSKPVLWQTFCIKVLVIALKEKINPEIMRVCAGGGWGFNAWICYTIIIFDNWSSLHSSILNTTSNNLPSRCITEKRDQCTLLGRSIQPWVLPTCPSSPGQYIYRPAEGNTATSRPALKLVVSSHWNIV